MASAAQLKRFLADPGRPPGTMSYHELQGFLFAVAAAPDLVRPSEWMPMIFDEAGASYQNIDEAKMVMAALTEIYNSTVMAINEQRPALPADCQFRPEALANLEDDAPVSQWSRGFTRGHSWLEESWDLPLPKAMDNDLALLMMTLSFFSSRKIAEAFAKESGRRGVARMAETIREVFSDAVIEYAAMGRMLQQAVAESSAQTVAPPGTRPPKVGRNERCPCGSGVKYKKCCGSGQVQ